MRHRITFTAIWILLFSGCSYTEWQAHRLEREMLKTLPVLFAGEHVPALMSVQKWSDASNHCIDYRAKLEQLRARASNAKTIAILDRAHRFLEGYETKVHSAATDPSWYNLGGHLKTTLAQSAVPLEKRLLAARQQMEAAKPYYDAARRIISHPDPSHTRLAIEKHLYALHFLEAELHDSIASSQLPPPDKDALDAAIAQTRLELKDYLAFCRSLLFEHQDSTAAQDLRVKK